MITDDQLLAAFEAATLSPEEWHHREHVKIAYLYLRLLPFEAAFERMRAGLIALNAAHRVPDAIDRGYHETITRGWMHLVDCTLREFGPAENADAFLEKQTQLLATRSLLFFYSRDRIMSAEAKRGFIEPDLAPFPKSRK